eukprot:7738100-Lingulodinium_polyedra.AAC.1
MVVDVVTSEGRWVSFMSDRFPEQLDDAIKGHSAELYMASQKLTPAELQEAIPMGFPMAHMIEGSPRIA